MKRKLLAMVCAVSMIASLGAATVYASDDVKATGDEKIALITMDSIDQHWITLNEGAQEEAKELGVTVDFMSPNTKDDAQQIECVNNAVAGGYDAIMVAANGPDAISSALQEAKDQGIKIVYVDSAKSQSIAENYITQGVVGIFGCNEGSTTGAGNAIKAAGNADIIGVGFDKSDAILNLIDDGYLLCTMAQNPDVMGSEGVKAAVKAINGEELGGEVTDTGVSVITKDSDK